MVVSHGEYVATAYTHGPGPAGSGGTGVGPLAVPHQLHVASKVVAGFASASPRLTAMPEATVPTARLLWVTLADPKDGLVSNQTPAVSGSGAARLISERPLIVL